MALTPGIPTSFVPRQPVQPTVRRPQSTGANLFLIISLIIGIGAVVAAGATFAYEKYLTYQLEQRAQELTVAQAQVDESRVEEFVRLRDRLSSGEQLLSNNIMLTRFFDTLEDVTLQNVRFTSMSITVAGDSTAKLDMEGTARNFNALAAQSNAFAGERSIRRAIFSGITLNSARQVDFRLTADLDSRLLVAGRDTVPTAPIDPLTVPVQTPPPAAQQATTTQSATTAPARLPQAATTTPRP